MMKILMILFLVTIESHAMKCFSPNTKSKIPYGVLKYKPWNDEGVEASTSKLGVCPTYISPSHKNLKKNGDTVFIWSIRSIDTYKNKTRCWYQHQDIAVNDEKDIGVARLLQVYCFPK